MNKSKKVEIGVIEGMTPELKKQLERLTEPLTCPECNNVHPFIRMFLTLEGQFHATCPYCKAEFSVLIKNIDEPHYTNKANA